MNSTEVKAEIASYLRFLRQYDLVLVEQLEQDVIAVDKSRRAIWVEVKVSISDLVRDREKPFHQRMCQERGLPLWKAATLTPAPSWINEHRPQRFYFAMPADLVEKAKPKIEEFYPWAGLFSVHATPPNRRFFGHGIECARKADKVHDEKVSDEHFAALVKCQSASLANVYAKLARSQKMVEYYERPDRDGWESAAWLLEHHWPDEFGNVAGP